MSDPVSAADSLTAGQWLRQARERQGMHIAILAAHIKVPTRKIEALETDDLSVFPSPVFARSLALSICRALKVDSAPVLVLLPQPESPMLQTPVRADKEAPVRLRAARPAGASGPSRTTVLVAASLVFVALGVAFAPDFSSRVSAPAGSAASPAGTVSEPVTSAVSMAQQVQVAEDNPAAAASAAPAPAATTAPAAPAATPSATAPSAKAPSATAASVTSANSTPAAPNPVPAASAASSPAANPASGVLALRTSGDSWIQVLDAQGQTLLSRVVLKGENLSLGGALPMSVVVGRVDMTEVSVRGQPFSMANIAQGNVARFEVK